MAVDPIPGHASASPSAINGISCSRFHVGLVVTGAGFAALSYEDGVLMCGVDNLEWDMFMTMMSFMIIQASLKTLDPQPSLHAKALVSRTLLQQLALTHTSPLTLPKGLP